MTKSLNVLLAVVVGVILIAAIVFFKTRDSGSIQVEVTARTGTKVFAKLPGGEEQFLNTVSTLEDDMISMIKVDVPIGAEIISRYNNQEDFFPYEIWKGKKAISVRLSIQIGAEPWAYVFIKLPDGDDFIKPRAQDFILPPGPDEENTNLIPIPSGLKVPSGTAIKLVYEGKEKVFPYEIWKNETEISHNFLNP